MLRVRVLVLSALATGGAAAVVAIGAALVTGSQAASGAATCTIYWTGASPDDSSWDNPANWSRSDGGNTNGSLPGASDFACMSTAPVDADVVAYTGNRTVAGIRFLATAGVVPTLTLQGGTLTLGGEDSVAANVTASGTVTGPSTLTVTGTGAFTTATLAGGQKTVAAGASYTAAALTIGTPTSPTTLVDAGALAVTGADLTVSMTNSGSTSSLLSVTGSLTLGNSGRVLAGATGAVKAAVVNTGTVTATGTGAKFVSAPFSNSGNVAVTAGTLTVSGGAVAGAPDTGTVTVADPATYEIAGGAKSVPAGSITGGGRFVVSGGAVDIAGTVPRFSLTGGTATGTFTTGVATLSGGSLSGGGTLTTTGTGSTFCNSALAAGYRLRNTGSAGIGACSFKVGPGVLENAGTLAFTSSGATVSEAVDDPGNAFLNDAGATVTVTMGGTGSQARLSLPASNAGTVQVTNGTLVLGDDASPALAETGVYQVSATGTLNLSDGSRPVAAGAWSGPGNFLVSGADVVFAAGFTTPALTLSGGTIGGSPTVGVLTTTGGTFVGNGTATLTGSGSTLCAVTLDQGYLLVNRGSASLNTSSCRSVVVTGGATFENAGTFALSGANANRGFVVDDTSGNVVNDAGATLTVAMSNASTAVPIDPAFSNAGTVTITRGKVSLTGGTAPAPDTGTYTVGNGAQLVYAGGSRTVGAGTLQGSGTVSVTGGTVTFDSAAVLPALTVAGGTVAGSPSIGALTLTSGTFTGTGTTTLTGSGSTLCAGTLQAGYRLLNQGTTTYQNDCGTLTLDGGILENAGNLTVTGGTGNRSIATTGAAGGAVRNDSGATLTVALTDATSALTVSSAFSTAGTVAVSTGTLVLAGGTGGAPDTGAYVTSASAALNLTGGNRNVTAAAFSGAGTVRLAGAAVTFGTGVTLPNLTLLSGSVAGSPTVAALTSTAGVFTGSGTTTVTGTSTVCAAAIGGGYRLLNQGTTTWDSGCGTIALSGGSTVENAGTLVLGGKGTSLLDDTDLNPANAVRNDAGAVLRVEPSPTTGVVTVVPSFVNAGTVNVNAGGLALAAGTPAGNPDSGAYATVPTATLTFAGGNRAVGSGTTFTGDGAVRIAGGTVTFTAGVTLPNLTLLGGVVNGSPTVTALTATAGTFGGSGTATLTGTSTLCATTVRGGYRLLVQGATTYDSGCGTLTLLGGSTVENAGTLTLSGKATSGITDDGNSANSLLNDAGATLVVNLFSGSTVVSASPPLANNGTLNAVKGTAKFAAVANLSANGTLSGGTWLAAGGTIAFPVAVTRNAAVLSLGATGGLAVGATPSPAAVAGLSANTGTLTIGQNVTGTASVTNSGTVNVVAATWRVTTYAQTAGATTVGVGALLKSGTTGGSPVTIDGGVLTGTGTVQGALSGNGTVAPGNSGAGSLAVTGSWTGTASSTLAVTAASSPTTLTVSGAATAAGTLAVTTPANPPAVGSTVTVLSAASVTGTFAAVTGSAVPSANAYWSVGYTARAVTLTLTALPQLSVAGGSVVEGNSGTASLPFAVTLGAASTQPVTVAYATSDGTATAGVDYTATTGTLTFAPGTTSQTASVPVLADTLYEGDETVVLTLSAPGGATLGASSSATGTILDDDARPAVSVGAASGTVGTGSGALLVFPVTLSAPSGLDVTVSYATSDGTAVAPADYTAVAGTVTIPAGSTSASVPVRASAQGGSSPPKTFTLTLSNPVRASLGTASATGTIVNSNASGGAPSLASVSPATADAGTSVSVVLTGQNFPSNAAVAVSGSGVSVTGITVASSTRITATVVVEASAAVGTRDVVLTGSNGSATCTGCFTVTARPVVTALSRTAFAAGNVDAQLDVTGANFTAGTTLSIVKGTKTIDATGISVDSASALTAYLTLAGNTTTGTYNVVLTNPDGGTSTCANCLTVFAAPKVTSVSPSTAAAGSSTTMTFTGSGFVAGARVTVQGATVSNLTVVNATTITATVTFPVNAATGSRTVKVFNPASAGSGTGALTNGVRVA